MTKVLKNTAMMDMIRQLEPILAYRGKIGYAAARNTRILRDALTEYVKFRDELIEKYGEPERDEHGRELPVYSIQAGSPNFKRFCDELAPYNEMEHEVVLMSAKFEDAAECLTGAEILDVDWMLED